MNTNLRKKVLKVLSDNNMGYDFSVDNDGFIEISVEFGDWKHDHLALRTVMDEAGFCFVGRHIPDDDESDDDTFSAIYLYVDAGKS